MIRVYGCSDDLFEIEDTNGCYDDEIGCFMKDVVIRFKDGTSARFSYGNNGAWKCKVERIGRAFSNVEECRYPDDENYSDVLMINAGVAGWDVVDKKNAG